MLAWIGGALLLIASFNFVVDPFRMNGFFDLGLDRDAVSRPMNYRLYKVIEFRKHPSSGLVLGDSRCDRLKASYFREEGGPEVYNMSFGGGTLYEAIDAFWFASRESHLRSVFLCVPFTLYDETNARNLVPEAVDLAGNPFAYYLSTFVAKAGLANLYTRVTGKLWRPEHPEMTRDAFWQHQLGPDIAGMTVTWTRPRRLLQRLQEVAAYARANGIELTLMIPPGHVELQSTVDRYGKREEYDRFKREIGEIAPTVDFDMESDLTADPANYEDPYHLTDAAARRVVRALVSGDDHWSRRLGRDATDGASAPDAAGG